MLKPRLRISQNFKKNEVGQYENIVIPAAELNMILGSSLSKERKPP